MFIPNGPNIEWQFFNRINSVLDQANYVSHIRKYRFSYIVDRRVGKPLALNVILSRF